VENAEGYCRLNDDEIKFLEEKKRIITVSGARIDSANVDFSRLVAQMEVTSSALSAMF